MSEERFVGIETRIAYQAHTINELNSTVLSMVNRMAVLERELTSLKDRLSSYGGSHVRELSEESPPPHY